MTFDTIRRGICPRASAAAVNELLWACSPYPFERDVRKLRRSIRRCWTKGGRSLEGAIDYSHRMLDEAMKELRAREEG